MNVALRCFGVSSSGLALVVIRRGDAARAETRPIFRNDSWQFFPRLEHCYLS